MLPVHLQPESHVPLYVQLRDQLRALVHAGDLRPGDRIPASRELAVALGVHRTTVANAYAELESEGLIQGHVGRGTFIRANGNGLKITPPAPPVLLPTPIAAFVPPAPPSASDTVPVLPPDSENVWIKTAPSGSWISRARPPLKATNVKDAPSAV